MQNDSQSVLIDVGQGLSLFSGLLRLTSWNNSTRPKKPKRGSFGFNTQSNSLEYFNGKYWLEASMSKL